MSVTITCRDINELHVTAQAACRLFLQECERAGVKIFITETYRSQARQNYLYEQGRTRPGQVVTWTKNSNHMGRLAWDIAVSPPVNLYDTATLNKAGAIARKLGITWGGDWPNNIDRPHFEVKTTWKAPAGNVAMEDPKKEGVSKLYQPTSKAIKDSTEEVLKQLETGENGLSNQWRKKLNDGTLTDSDAIGLLYVAASRGLLSK